MKKIKILIPLIIAACNRNPESRCGMRPACTTPDDRQALASFIIKCAEAANPKSDEEGEDLVKQCQWSGNEVICPQQKQCWNGNAHTWELMP